MTDKIFADGLMFQEPSEKAPSWVKGKISVNVKKFTDFLNQQQNERGWVNLDVKQAKGGSIYVELDTYKPGQPKERSEFQKQTEQQEEELPVIEDEIDIKDIPF